MRRTSLATLSRPWAALCGLALLVAAQPACRRSPTEAPAGAAPASTTTGDAGLDAVIDLLQPTLEANRRTFAGATGTVHAFAAGASYPQVWLRDSATLLPVARYHYGRPALSSWIEEHLAHQQPDGALFDWVAPGPPERFRDHAPRVRQVLRKGALLLSADRNTTECDQESSAVLAAARVTAITGDTAWLARPVAGRSLLERLDHALLSVWRGHRHPVRGLVVSALTADWGDVSPTYEDQRAIYLDEATPRVVGVYTNAMFHGAALALAGLHERVGDAAAATRWRAVAAEVRTEANRGLWQEGFGFYRMHVPVDASAPAFDGSSIFALGGNAAAVRHRLADAARAARIFDRAEERRRELGLATVAGVLLPPFPRGFFRHPVMREEYTYQNGGQWDWLAGRFVVAEFAHGRAERARDHLRALAARAAAAGGLHEWATRDGRGMGSATYAGSAGALGEAIYEGLFGVDLSAAGLSLTPRLGPLEGRLRLREPATGREVAYEYRRDRGSRRVLVAYRSNVPGAGTVRVLLPPGAAVEAATLDAAPLETRLVTIGEDRYAEFSTDWRPHRLELRLTSPE